MFQIVALQPEESLAGSRQGVLCGRSGESAPSVDGRADTGGLEDESDDIEQLLENWQSRQAQLIARWKIW